MLTKLLSFRSKYNQLNYFKTFRKAQITILKQLFKIY